MKLTIVQNENIPEDEIIIRTPHMNSRLEKIVRSINQYSTSITGKKDGKEFQVPLEFVVYLESVEGKTFFYTKEQAYESGETLQGLEEKLVHTSLCRISKSVLVNMEHIQSIEPYPNHRLLLNLFSKDRLIVNRKFLGQLKSRMGK